MNNPALVWGELFLAPARRKPPVHPIEDFLRAQSFSTRKQRTVVSRVQTPVSNGMHSFKYAWLVTGATTRKEHFLSNSNRTYASEKRFGESS